MAIAKMLKRKKNLKVEFVPIGDTHYLLPVVDIKLYREKTINLPCMAYVGDPWISAIRRVRGQMLTYRREN